MTKLAPLTWTTRIAWALEYDPSWFVEAGGALGVFLWSLFAFTTDDFARSDWHYYILPTFGIIGGPLRAILLMRLWYGARMFGAAVAVTWWGIIAFGLLGSHGTVPMAGAALALMFMEVLTMLRFSLAALAEIIQDVQRWLIRRKAIAR